MFICFPLDIKKKKVKKEKTPQGWIEWVWSLYWAGSFLQAFGRWKSISRGRLATDWPLRKGWRGEGSELLPLFPEHPQQASQEGDGGSAWKHRMTLENNLQAMLLFSPPRKNACLLPVSLQWWDSDVVLSSSLPTGVAQHLVSRCEQPPGILGHFEESLHLGKKENKLWNKRCREWKKTWENRYPQIREDIAWLQQ